MLKCMGNLPSSDRQAQFVDFFMKPKNEFAKLDVTWDFCIYFFNEGVFVAKFGSKSIEGTPYL